MEAQASGELFLVSLSFLISWLPILTRLLHLSILRQVFAPGGSLPPASPVGTDLHLFDPLFRFPVL